MLNESSSPTVSNCTFSGNTAGDKGGGMINGYNSSPTISDCVFSGNTATNGGGMYTSSGSPVVSDSSFCVNTPDQVLGAWTDNGGNVINDDYCPPPRPIYPFGDSDGDGDVDMFDLAAFAANWLAGTEP
jgi:predicted outer membrane repeat protein